MEELKEFHKRKYLNLETFRKDGDGVKTPVWFVQDGDRFYVKTMSDSGKVKRIHRNGNVNIAVCRMDGSLIGRWMPAEACEITDAELDRHVDRLLARKYGIMKRIFDRQTRKEEARQTILEIKKLD